MKVSSNNSIPTTLSSKQPRAELDKDTINSIRGAMATLDEERKAYTPTSQQLKDAPWLKNAADGLNKVSDILEGYAKGIDGSGEITLSWNNNKSFEVVNAQDKTTDSYEIFSTVEETITHLAWDDENYTKEGSRETRNLNFVYRHQSYEGDRTTSIGNLKFDIENAGKVVDFTKLTDRLETDKEFEDVFLGGLKDYFTNNSSTKLIDSLKEGLDIEGATVSLAPSDDSTTYEEGGELDFNKGIAFQTTV